MAEWLNTFALERTSLPLGELTLLTPCESTLLRSHKEDQDILCASAVVL